MAPEHEKDILRVQRNNDLLRGEWYDEFLVVLSISEASRSLSACFNSI